MDNLFTFCIIDIVELGAFFIAMVITICGIMPIFLVVAFFLFVNYFYLLVLFKQPIINLKRLELINKGPLFSYFSSTINGILIMRVFKQKAHFRNNFESYINAYASTNFSYWLLCRGFAITYELIGNVYSSIGIFICCASISD